MKRLSRDGLSFARVDVWHRWFRDGFLVFTQQAKLEDRVKAFWPLILDPLGHNPAGDLADQIQTVVKGRITIPSRACAQVLSEWSLIHDGWKGARLALQVATRIGSPDLSASSVRLISQSRELPGEAGEWLAWTAIRAAKERFMRSEIAKLGEAIARSELWTSPLVAEFSALLARDDLKSLPVALLAAAPGILAEPHTGEYARGLAKRLTLEHDRKTLRAAFAPNSGDDENESRIRRVLAEEMGVAREITIGLIEPIEQARLRAKIVRTFQSGAELRGQDLIGVEHFEISERHMEMLRNAPDPGARN